MLRRLHGERVRTRSPHIALPHHCRRFPRLSRGELDPRRRLQHPCRPSDRHLLLVLLRRDEHLRVLPHLGPILDASTGDHARGGVQTGRVLPRVHDHDARERFIVYRVRRRRPGRVRAQQPARERVLPRVGNNSGGLTHSFHESRTG